MILLFKIGNLISFVMAAIFCAQLWNYRRTHLTRLYLINLSIVMYWAFSVLLTDFADNFFLKVQFTKMRQLALPFLTINWLIVFILIFHKELWCKIKKFTPILYIIPVLTSTSTLLSLMGIKFFENLISHSFTAMPAQIGLLEYRPGLLLTTQFLYAALLMITILALFVCGLASKKNENRKLRWLFLSCAIFQIGLEYFARTKYGSPVLIQCNALSYIPMLIVLYFAIHKMDFLNIKTFSNQVAFDHLPLPVITVNPKGELWDANHQSFELFSLKNEDLGASIFHDSRFLFIQSREKTIFINKNEYQVNYHELTLNSRSILIVSLTDITPIAELNNELSENNSILKMMNSEILKITSFNKKINTILAHDLSGLLNYMLISLTHLFKNASIQESDKKLAEGILKTNHSSIELLNNILTWSYEESMVDVSIHSLLQEISTSQSMLLKEHQVELDINVDQQHTFKTSYRTMQTILRNLLSNAIKNSPAKSTVTVVATIQQAELEIYIVDQGTGIDPVVLKNIKETRNHQKSGYGFGIGLQLTLDLVKQLNGSIHFEAGPKLGTIVRLHFFN